MKEETGIDLSRSDQVYSFDTAAAECLCPCLGMRMKFKVCKIVWCLELQELSLFYLIW